jgi:multicomponent Na+:H+ antiporter subunit B
MEALDGLGAAGYGLMGIGGLIFASAFLENFLPLGIPGHLLSGGFMPLNSIAVGIEVTGAFLLVWTEFLDQALLISGGGS